MLKKYFKQIFIMIFLIFSVILTAEDNFMAVGNIKIVRPEPLLIKREDLNITIEKDNTIKVESMYTFSNLGEYNIKSTFMFWLDQTRENDNNNPNNSNKNNKGKYIKNIKFYSDYKKSQNLRAVIKFDENLYENQSVGNIQREWFAISKVIPSKEEGRLGVYYDLQNTGFNKTKKFVYSFDLVSNFSEKNKVEILYVNVYNKSGRKIDSIVYKDYEFKNLTGKKSQKEHYELLVANVNLDEKLVINFK